MHLEEPSCLQLENKLVVHLVSWLILAKACPFVKQHHNLLAQPWRVRVIPQRRPHPATTCSSAFLIFVTDKDARTCCCLSFAAFCKKPSYCLLEPTRQKPVRQQKLLRSTRTSASHDQPSVPSKNKGTYINRTSTGSMFILLAC